MSLTWVTCPGCQVLIPLDSAPDRRLRFCPECGAILADQVAAEAQWFYARDRQKEGPVSLTQLRQLAGDGRLAPTDMLLAEGAAKWIPAATVEGLFGVTEPAFALPTRPHSTIDFAEGKSEAAPSGPLPSVPGYEVLSELGRGGMGVVYKARQIGLKRLVALKMILSGACAGPQEVARFRREAEAAARLQHPNIVQIYEVGEADGRPYFSMECVEGGNLATRLADGPLPAVEAARMTETLARAVHAAHLQGVIHRDLKPANILLVSGGVVSGEWCQEGTAPPATTHHSPLTTHQPKITDFGLAKQLDSGSLQTRSGAMLGTPSYVAPEQAAGKTKDVGPAADIYALGAILYEMLTGLPPFRGETPLDTVLQVMSQEPVSIRRLAPQSPRDLETICLKCLDKSPGRRYATAEALADDLRRFVNGEPIAARPAGKVEQAWRWCRRYPVPASLLVGVSVLLIVVTLGSAFGLWHLTRLSEELVRSTAIESAAQQSEMLETLNSFYSAEVVDRVRPSGIEITHDYAAKKGAIPLPATLTIDLGNHLAQQSQRGMRLRLYSDYPFKSRSNGGPKDAFEWEALGRLRANPAEPVYRFEPYQGRPTLRYATARVMKESCVRCHNSHPESTKNDWKVGDVRGVVEIIRPLDRDVARTQDGLRGTFILIGAISGSLLLGLTALVVLLGFWTRRYAQARGPR